MLTRQQIKTLRVWRGLSLSEVCRLGNYSKTKQSLWNYEQGKNYLTKTKCIEIIRCIETAFDKKFNNMLEIERIELKVKKIMGDYVS